jgi:hypothetical protein
MLSSVGAASIDGMQDEAPATTASMLTMPGFRHGIGCPCCTPGKSPATMNQQTAFMGHDTVDVPISDAVDKKAKHLHLNKLAEYTLEMCCRQKYEEDGPDIAAAYLTKLEKLPDYARIKITMALDQGARPIV